MDTTITYKTSTNSHYLYDNEQKLNLLSHPLLNYLIEYFYKYGDDKFREFENLHVEELKKYTKQDYSYYVGKFNFLHAADLFRKVNHSNELNGEITTDAVRSNFSNTKQLTFEVTERCNLNCVYCGYGPLYSNNQKRTRHDLKFEDAQTIIDEVVKCKNSAYSLSSDHTTYIGFYGGEPLLNIDLIKKIVEYINVTKGEGLKTQYAITTNALLLDKHIDFFVEHNFNVLISLDGNKTNNSLRLTHSNKNSFDQIIKNVDFVKQKYELFFQERVRFNSVLHSKNSVEDIQKFFSNKYNKMPSISELNTNGINQDCRNEFEETYNSFFVSYNQSNKKDNIDESMGFMHPDTLNINRFTYAGTNFAYYDYNDLLFQFNKKDFIPTGTCEPYANNIFVTATGSILPCERIGTKNYFGKVSEGKLNFNHSEFIKSFNSSLRKIKRKCRECYLSSSCSQCVFYTNNGKTCEYFTNKKVYTNYLSDTISALERSKIGLKKIINDITIDL